MYAIRKDGLGWRAISSENEVTDDETFSAQQPAPIVIDPRASVEVTAFQAHAAIARAGLYEQVETLMSDPQTPLEVKLAWNKAQTFKRLSPTVLAMGAALGLDDEALDNLFTLAATIDA